MKLLRQLALITLLLQSTANVFAYEVNPLIAPPLALDVTALLVANPGALASTHIYISTSVGSYDFLLMSGFRMENDAVRGEVHFNSFNNSCWLTFRLITQIPNAPTLTKSTCTQYLQDEYPRAKITSELSANAANFSGPAFDLASPALGGLPSAMRIAFLPTSQGILEFRLHSNLANFAAGYRAGKRVRK